MRLAAIYNVWDGDELLRGSIHSVYDHVDVVIIVYQTVSNFGEKYTPALPSDGKIVHILYTPKVMDGRHNEVAKRNIGLQIAKEMDMTHFLHMDCDEYYMNFGETKEMYINSGSDGSACRLHTYFKLPTLRLDQPENYYVPFIHKLHRHTEAGCRIYPFYVDPTRRINTGDVIELPIFMHHYSYVRKDIGRKIRNSTAKKTIEKKHWVDYQRDLKPGDYLPCFDRKLIEAPDYFSVNEMI